MSPTFGILLALAGCGTPPDASPGAPGEAIDPSEASADEDAGDAAAEALIRSLPIAPAKLGEGLELFSSDETGMSGAFKAGGRAIYFDALKGDEIDALADDDGEPTDDPALVGFEIDSRFRDQDGVTFMVGLGGDHFIDSSWADDMWAGSHVVVDGDLRAEDFDMAVQALGEIGRAREAVVDPELSANLLSMAVGTADVLAAPADCEAPDPSVSYSAATYSQTIEIRYKGAWIAPEWLAQHSAVRVKVYNSSCTLVGTYYTANHGTSANDSSMSTSCSKSFTGRSSSVPYFYDQECEREGSTYGVGTSQHVCNDDSYAQYANVKANAASCYLQCGDGSLSVSNYAPSCL